MKKKKWLSSEHLADGFFFNKGEFYRVSRAIWC